MNARHNPFRTDRILQVRYRLSGEEKLDLLERLRRLGYRGAIVGPKGSGKTTLLEDLEPDLVARGFRARCLRLDATTQRFPRAFLKEFFARLTANHVILLDGAEQMNWLEWRRFKRNSNRAGGLVITCHNPGMLPTVKNCSTSPELLGEIIRELVDGASFHGLNQTEDLHRKHNGNLREALREMYDRYAGIA
jgi:hypothetical protein